MRMTERLSAYDIEESRVTQAMDVPPEVRVPYVSPTLLRLGNLQTNTRGQPGFGESDAVNNFGWSS